MRRIIITTYHEVPDPVADELHEAMRREGETALLRFIQEHPPETIGFNSGGIKPAAEDSPA